MTPDRFKPLLDSEFLKAELDYEFKDFVASGEDDRVKERLERWAKRELKRETQAEGSFTQRFFIETWGYSDDGVGSDTFNLWPKFAIAGAGQTGGRGEADLAVGTFGKDRAEIPQVVCEFKDIRSGLDKPQNRKGNNRSPVYQARDYLWNARRRLFGNEPVQPRFAIVTDMDEFRLYWWDDFPDRYLRFKLTDGDLFNPQTLLDEGEEAAFERFIFWRLFQPDMLLSEAGRTRLERLIERQGKREKKLEGDFYKDYQNYRRVLINHVLQQKPAEMTKGAAVRLAQKLLDRLIFVMFAEDMGQRVGFPPNELQQQLRRFSEDRMLEPNGDEVWRRIRLIFDRMNSGGRLGDTDIHRFNGGLFEDDPAIDGLTLPNWIFVRRDQGRNEGSLAQHKETLFYLSATYNYAREADAKNSIGLYTLGHIFEQSIVELEALQAEAEGRQSLAEITKRKRDGVYYTPEWVVRRIIEETIDPLFARWKVEAAWPETGDPSKESALAYWDRLRQIRVIDPACGSGAFLILALRHLEKEFAATLEAARGVGAVGLEYDPAAITDMILSNNLYGVDINPASVEITQLSLWLHTAQPDKPLSSLGRSIRCGNSLIDSRFYDKRRLDDPEERERVNTFDWELKDDGTDFSPGSFDAVIGNPPYVKLQNFRTVHADMADWLMKSSPYLSTKTGNFDLYLPFIEKGLSLLNEGGRMGFIAPNLWPTLEYGAGLRGLVHEGRHLEKWLDFRSFQVFEEATIYTAIQIFSKAPIEAVRLAFVPTGDVSKVDWSDPDRLLPYNEVPPQPQPWLIAPSPVRSMIQRLDRDAVRLGHPEHTSAIFQGLITSAEHVYHLKKKGPNRYACTPQERRIVNGRSKLVKLAPVAVELEDAIMKPLVSGAEVKRFIEPQTDTYLLFPYKVDADGARLFTINEMQAQFPQAWEYLKSFEIELRNRESKSFDDDEWYRFGRHQALDKQELPKLLVAQLVPELRLSFDERGAFYINNVRVNGILPRGDNGWFLLGALNAPISDYIFKWIGKPKNNAYYEANKQFIAPLPIPHAGRADRAGLSALARGMQERRTRQVELRAALNERLAATARVTWPLEKILPNVRSIVEIEAETPTSVPLPALKKWVDERRKEEEEAALAEIDGTIQLDSEASVDLREGKLSSLTSKRLRACSYRTTRRHWSKRNGEQSRSTSSQLGRRMQSAL